MMSVRSAASLLISVLLILVVTAGAAKSDIGRILVLNGRVVMEEGGGIALPGGPYLLMDRLGRTRGHITLPGQGELDGEKNVESLFDNLGEGLESSVYLLVPGGAAAPVGGPRSRAGEDVKTDTGDVDGDGDADIVVARELAPARLLINEDGTFVDHSERLPQVSGFATDVELVDVDGDSLPDIFFTYNDEQNRLFINDGAGTFGDFTTTRLPVDSATSQAASWGDVDDDGDNDIFVVNLGIPFDPASDENQLLINDGSGFFTDLTHDRFLFQPVRDISFDALVIDSDNINGMDIVIINDNFNGDQPRLLVNDGTGHFTDETQARFPDSNGSCMSVSGRDFDGDERPDLYIANYFYEMNFLWMNDGNGTFYDETEMRTPHGSGVDSSWSWGCDAADIENDNDNDIVVGNYLWVPDTLYTGRGRNRLLVNDGFGFFTDRTFQVFPNVENTTWDMDFLDANGNEWIDLYVTNSGQPSLLKMDPGVNVSVESGEPLQPPVPAVFSLHQNYPNPFNPSTTIRFTVPSSEKGRASVCLFVYDLKGRLVKKLLSEFLEPGLHSVVWDGRNARGMKVASGVYVARISVDGESRNIKMTLLK